MDDKSKAFLTSIQKKDQYDELQTLLEIRETVINKHVPLKTGDLITFPSIPNWRQGENQSDSDFKYTGYPLVYLGNWHGEDYYLTEEGNRKKLLITNDFYNTKVGFNNGHIKHTDEVSCSLLKEVFALIEPAVDSFFNKGYSNDNMLKVGDVVRIAHPALKTVGGLDGIAPEYAMVVCTRYFQKMPINREAMGRTSPDNPLDVIVYSPKAVDGNLDTNRTGVGIWNIPGFFLKKIAV